MRYERRGAKLESGIADFLVHIGKETAQEVRSLQSRSTLQQRTDFSGADGTFNILVIPLGNRAPGFSGGIVDDGPLLEVRGQISLGTFQRVSLPLLKAESHDAILFAARHLHSRRFAHLVLKVNGRRRLELQNCV